MQALSVDDVGKSALAKATWRLVPLIGVGYGAAYVDRVNISFASVQMNQDLHFSASMYGLGAGLFFISYALCEIPSNLLLVRFGARRWLARIMLTWGLLAMGMLLVKTPAQFYTMRFLLGAAEAGFFPGVIFYLTEWFPPEYRARTISRFYIALPLSSTVMGSLAGWLMGLNGRMGLAGWQWLFLVEGLPPLALSVLFFLYLPDKPADAKWLTAAERDWLEGRLAEAREGLKDASHTLADLLSVATDPRVLTVGLVFFCQLTVLYAWSFSAPIIMQLATHKTIGQVGTMIAGLGLLGAVAMLWTAQHSDRSGERDLHIVIPFLIMAAGYLAGGLLRSPLLAVVAFSIAAVAYNAAQGPVLSLPSSFLRGRASAFGFALMNGMGMVGGFLGPYWMGRARDLTGDYQRGLLTLAIPCVAAATLIWSLRRRRAREFSSGTEVLPVQMVAVD